MTVLNIVKIYLFLVFLEIYKIEQRINNNENNRRKFNFPC